ncbi:ferritin-like domain-containing protein, partial [Sinorhizobium medicae]
MYSYSIRTLDELKEFLHRAMQLEHATIPPYMTALYSIKPGSNQ